MATKKIEEIKTHPTFESLFPVNGKLLNEIEQDMRNTRYDFSQPIILATWQGQKDEVCIDGHTRLKAAIKAGLEEVPVFSHEFDTEQEAIEKAIKLQRNRRNMTDAELTACIAALDKKKPRGGDRRSEEAKSKVSDEAIEKTSGKSAANTAELLGVSTSKVERVRSVLSNGDPDTIEALKNGEISANQAYQKTRENRKTESKPTNAAEKTNDEGQEPEKAEESEKSPDYGPVFLSVEHFGALRELGGCIDEHVANAIEAYLGSFKNQCEQASTGDAPEDDDEEYFDPADDDEE